MQSPVSFVVRSGCCCRWGCRRMWSEVHLSRQSGLSPSPQLRSVSREQHHGGGEPIRRRCALINCSVPSAAANHIKVSIPASRKFHGEPYFRPDGSSDYTVRGNRTTGTDYRDRTNNDRLTKLFVCKPKICECLLGTHVSWRTKRWAGPECQRDKHRDGSEDQGL